MTIEIRRPELEQLVQEEFLTGHFESVDDLLTEALHALREKRPSVSDAGGGDRKVEIEGR
jgi:hypothetical protein